MSGERFRPTWAEVDTAAFSRNSDAVVRMLPERARLIAVLKANAYAHGAVELARVCDPERVAMIAVALLEEALQLRRAGITLPVIVFGPVDARGIVAAIENGGAMRSRHRGARRLDQRAPPARPGIKRGTGCAQQNDVFSEFSRGAQRRDRMRQ